MMSTSWRAAWGFWAWAAPLAITMIALPIMVRTIGTAHFGVLILALATPVYAGHFDFGMIASATRDFAHHVDEPAILRSLARAYLLRLAVVGTTLGAAIAVAAWPIAHVLGFSSTLGADRSGNLVLLCASWFAVSTVAALPGALVRAQQRMAVLMVVQTISTALNWGLGLAMLLLGVGIEAVVWLGIALTVASSLVFMSVSWSILGQGPTVRAAPSSLKFSLTIFGGQIASFGAYHADKLVIATLISPAAAGVYALAVNLTSKVMGGAQALTSFALPQAAGLFARADRHGRDSLYWVLNRALVLFCMPTVVPAFALASSFYALWLHGTPDATMVDVFRVLWLGYVLGAFSIPGSYLLIGAGRATLPSTFAWVTAGTAIALQVVLIPAVGLVGAGVAVAVGLSSSLLFDYAARRNLRIGRDPSAKKFLAGAIIGVAFQIAIAWALPNPEDWIAWIVQALTLLSVFFLSRAVCGVLGPEESRLMSRAWQHMVSLLATRKG
jgi:O-antigen/teichoic acid export membrane protein